MQSTALKFTIVSFAIGLFFWAIYWNYRTKQAVRVTSLQRAWYKGRPRSFNLN
jgi:hypothetical protein